MKYDIELALVFWGTVLTVLLGGFLASYLDTDQGLSLTLAVALLMGFITTQLYHLLGK